MGTILLEGIGENVHPRSLIEKLKSETNGEGDHVFLNKIIVKIQVLQSVPKIRCDVVKIISNIAPFFWDILYKWRNTSIVPL